ncbi:MAG: serine protease [candidate division KSB1 bacterium]|nr:serine protease [candidate division KSB1 bacterium]
MGCANRTNHHVVLSDHGLISPRAQENIRSVVASVVGVAAMFDYRLDFFRYETVNGQFIPDAISPTGYRLAKVANPITTAKKIQKVHGGGLIIYRDDRNTVILTTEHILSSPDTIRTYYRDAAGNETKVLSSRAVKKRTTHHVIDQINQLLPAEVLHTDPRADLGLVMVTTSQTLGLTFPYSIAYKSEVKWGDVAFVFGFPREIKQLSVGLISPSPYPGVFSLDVVGRFGFSGGPVFVIRPGGDLELAGIIRGVPVNKLQYIAPPPEILPGQNLQADDLERTTAQEIDMIEYGTVYALGVEKIGRFLKDSVPILEKKGIYLSRHLLPK